MPFKYTLGPAIAYIFGAVSLFVAFFVLLADSGQDVPAAIGYLFLFITFIAMAIAAAWTIYSYYAIRRDRRAEREAKLDSAQTS